MLHWIRLLKVPLTARRSNQSILKEIQPEYSLEGLMLKLKLQLFGHLMGKTDSFEKTLKLGKIEGRRRRGWQKMRKLDGINSVDVSLSKLWKMVKDGKPGVLQSMGLQRVGHDWATEQQQQRHILYSQKPKAMVFLVVMYGCESWSIKKAKCQRIDAS